MVDAGAEVRDLLDRHAAEAGDHLHRALHRVAEPDDVLLRRPLVDELADHRHRVRVVQEPRAGADLGHVVADAEHHRRGAQRADDAADAERVADRLADAVAGRDLVVAHGRRVAADLDAVDHVVGAVERLAAVEGRRDPRLRAERLGRRGARATRPSRAAPGSMSCSEISLPASSGNARMSPSRLRVNSTLPAPTNAILGIWLLTNREWRAIVESQTRSAPSRDPCPPRSVTVEEDPAHRSRVWPPPCSPRLRSPARARPRRSRSRSPSGTRRPTPRRRRCTRSSRSSTRRIRASSCTTSSARTATRWCRSCRP